MVSADFANIGAARGWRMYVVTVPFLNAAIQGLDQLYQIVRFRSRRDRSSPIWGRGRRGTRGQDAFLRADSLVNGMGGVGTQPSQ